MCGIGGILRITPPGEAARAALERTPFDAIPEAWLDELDASIRHRGPDGQGRFRDRAVRADGTVVDVAFVHRRLSIIDHGGGAQPMVSQREPRGAVGGAASEQVGQSPASLFQGAPAAAVSYRTLSDVFDRVAVVFNGCIYNHRELRTELQALGHRFESDHSDTEVLLHGWRAWEEQLAARLDGMFAFAIWDRRRGRLALSRDTFGEKPLHLCHVHRDGSWLNVFSSVPSAGGALAAMIGRSDVDVRSRSTCLDWLRYGWSTDQPVQGAGAVTAGVTVCYQAEFDGDGPHNPTPPPRVFPFGLPARWVRRCELDEETVERLLSDAVRERLDADAPLGCFLSGGVDSSLVAAMAMKHGGELKTFTVKMPDAAYDESAYAEEVAAHLGCRHTTLACKADPAGDLVRLVRQIGLPFGDSSLLPAYWVSRAAREHVKVVLSGDGGDELFAGYERYGSIPWWALTAPGLSVLGLRLAKASAPKSTRSKLARLIDAAAHDGYGDIISVFPYSMMKELVNGGEEAIEGVRFPKYSRLFSPEMAISFDLLNYLPEDLMRKTDSASMSVALEVRAPFLDRQVVEAATNATLRSLMPRNQRKGLLRAVARRRLPAHIVDRPKMGFAIPIGEWFRTDYGGMKTLLLDHLNSVEPFGPPSLAIDLNMGFVRQMLDEHLGTGASGLVKRDHSQRLYMLLVLSIWAKWLGSLPA